jgi:hypothetical protein
MLNSRISKLALLFLALFISAGTVLGVNTTEEDRTPPVTTHDFKDDGRWVNAPVVIRLQAADSGSGVAGIYYTVNGVKYRGDRIEIFEEGASLVEVWAEDKAGNEETPQRFTVMLDMEGPELSYYFQPENLDGWNNTPVIINFQAYDELSGLLSVSEPATVTTEGIKQPIVGEAVDRAGNKTVKTVEVYLDRTPPEVVDIRPLNGSNTKNKRPKIIAVFKDNLAGVDPKTVKLSIDWVEITEGVKVTKDGLSYTPDQELADGIHTVAIMAGDYAKNEAIPVNFTFSIDPNLMETATEYIEDPTDETRFYRSVEHLFKGANPVQTGIVPRAVTPNRAAVIRGKVLNQDQKPLMGVAVSVADYPKYGRTVTGKDGTFALVVDGGDLLTLRYEHSRYGVIEQQVEPAWQEDLRVPEVVMGDDTL